MELKFCGQFRSFANRNTADQFIAFQFEAKSSDLKVVPPVPLACCPRSVFLVRSNERDRML